jgi:hypothetical protein
MAHKFGPKAVHHKMTLHVLSISLFRVRDRSTHAAVKRSVGELRAADGWLHLELCVRSPIAMRASRARAGDLPARSDEAPPALVAMVESRGGATEK